MKKIKVIMGAVALVSSLSMIGCSNATTPSLDQDALDHITYENTIDGDPVVAETIITELDEKGVNYSGEKSLSTLFMSQSSEAAYKKILDQYNKGNEYQYETLTTLKGNVSTPLEYPAEGTRFVDFTRNEIKVTTYNDGKFTDKSFSYEIRFKKTPQNNVANLKNNAVVFIKDGGKLIKTVAPAAFEGTPSCIMPNAELKTIWSNANAAYNVRVAAVKAELAKYNKLKNAYDVWYNFVNKGDVGFNGKSVSYKSSSINIKNPGNMVETVESTIELIIYPTYKKYNELEISHVFRITLPELPSMKEYADSELVDFENEVIKTIADDSINNGKNWYVAMDGNYIKFYLTEEALKNVFTDPVLGYNNRLEKEVEGLYIKFDATNGLTASDVENESLEKAVSFALGIKNKEMKDVDLCNTTKLNRTKITSKEFNAKLALGTKENPWKIAAAKSVTTTTKKIIKVDEQGNATKEDAMGAWTEANLKKESVTVPAKEIPASVLYLNVKKYPWHGSAYNNKMIVEVANDNDPFMKKQIYIDGNNKVDIGYDESKKEIVADIIEGYDPYFETLQLNCPGSILAGLDGVKYNVTIVNDKRIELKCRVPYGENETDYKNNNIVEVILTRD